MFHNTIDLQGSDLDQANRKTQTQKQRVLRFFKTYHDGRFTPSAVHSHLGGASPLTSTRRAISDLTKAGLLEKTDHQEKGEYGTLNYTWCLKQEKGQLKLL